jgi:hypothetical protein
MTDLQDLPASESYLGDSIVQRTGLLVKFWGYYAARREERGPEVRFEAVSARSNIFQASVVIHCVSQFLLASQVMLGGLHGCMAKQELILFKFSAG